MGGALATGVCSGTFCGTCVTTIGSGAMHYARYKTPCPPGLAGICAQIGAVYQPY
jgi:hypothetical protein